MRSVNVGLPCHMHRFFSYQPSKWCVIIACMSPVFLNTTFESELAISLITLSESEVSGSFLANRIRISEILLWDRSSYLTHAILPRLSHEGYIHWLYWNSRTLSSSDVIVMLNCISAYSGTSGSLFLIKKTVVSKKRNPSFV